MKCLPVILTIALALSGCSGGSSTNDSAQPAEIPITSKSPEAIDHFKKGRDLAENIRFAEATEEFGKAIALDPDFALAMAYHGSALPGLEGLKELEEASNKAAAVSKPEQLVIEAMLASRRGEFTKTDDLWKKVAEAVPGDWRAHLGRGGQLFAMEKYQEAITSLEKATQLNPNAGPAFNMMGYSHLLLGEPGPAVDALRKYVALQPSEPNPQDSLGEALMANGQFAEAAEAFQKATKLSPGFSMAWEGVAYSKFFAGDWAGGQAAIEMARKSATRPVDRHTANVLGAFGMLAEGKTAEGLKQLDGIATSPDALPGTAEEMHLNRAGILADGGKYKEALAEAGVALKAANAGTFPQLLAANLRRVALGIMASIQGRMGDTKGVEESVMALQKETGVRPDDPALQSTVHFSQGVLAMTMKDKEAAKMHFQLCSDLDFACHWQAFEFSKKSGDKAGSDTAYARLTKRYIRDPLYLYARTLTARK